MPRLELVAPVVATTMDSGAIEGPPVASDVAWLEQTRKPGEIGPAILGHCTDNIVMFCHDPLFDA